MKKILLLIVVIALLAGCEERCRRSGQVQYEHYMACMQLPPEVEKDNVSMWQAKHASCARLADATSCVENRRSER